MTLRLASGVRPERISLGQLPIIRDGGGGGCQFMRGIQACFWESCASFELHAGVCQKPHWYVCRFSYLCISWVRQKSGWVARVDYAERLRIFIPFFYLLALLPAPAQAGEAIENAFSLRRRVRDWI